MVAIAEDNGFGINRNIVECKARFYWMNTGCWYVLIETLWNVKILWVLRHIRCWHVLIETLWNVKNYPGHWWNPRSRRINRNIVECKDIFLQVHLEDIFVLIETLWNVKKMKQELRKQPYKVLIETLWNVKWNLSCTGIQTGSGINRNIVECKVRPIVLVIFGNEY